MPPLKVTDYAQVYVLGEDHMITLDMLHSLSHGRCGCDIENVVRLMSWIFALKLHERECQKTSLKKLVNIGSGNGCQATSYYLSQC